MLVWCKGTGHSCHLMKLYEFLPHPLMHMTRKLKNKMYVNALLITYWYESSNNTITIPVMSLISLSVLMVCKITFVHIMETQTIEFHY